MTKLKPGTLPAGHSVHDFESFGPPAVRDGEFAGTKICDMGFFDAPVVGDDRSKDSNKYLHAAVVKSKKTGAWYAYSEWGRTGAASPSFQFIECDSEEEAQAQYESKCHEKNDRRGQWVTVAGIKTLQPKPGKDAYLVRALSSRSTGLPSAKMIRCHDGAKPKAADASTAVATLDGPGGADGTPVPPKSRPKPTRPPVHAEVVSLLRDLNHTTVAYTRSSMADSSLPTQAAIDEARLLLIEALKRVVVVGDDVDKQVQDPDLLQITKVLYGRIPKVKPLRAAASTWALSSANILNWQNDLDAFESAIYADKDTDAPEADDNPYGDMRLELEWLDPTSAVGRFVHGWWPKATANRHSHVGALKPKNVWKVHRPDDVGQVVTAQQKILAEVKANKCNLAERPLFQPAERPDLSPRQFEEYQQTNTNLLFHGTRTTNVLSILRTSFRTSEELKKLGVVISGAMFSAGGGAVYFADDIKKSVGYTSHSSSYYARGGGAVKGRGAFMFLNDVVLGNLHVAKGPHPFAGPPAKTHAVFGKAGVSGVVNNEFIIYDKRQTEHRYLVEFA